MFGKTINVDPLATTTPIIIKDVIQELIDTVVAALETTTPGRQILVRDVFHLAQTNKKIKNLVELIGQKIEDGSLTPEYIPTLASQISDTVPKQDQTIDQVLEKWYQRSEVNFFDFARIDPDSLISEVENLKEASQFDLISRFGSLLGLPIAVDSLI
jgi:hypothetical protein